MNITSNMSNLKVSMNETSTTLDSTIRDQDAHLDRIEKLETDLILMKDEHEDRLLTLSSNVNYVKDNYMSRPLYTEQTNFLKEELLSCISSNEQEIKLLKERMDKAEGSIQEADDKIDSHQTNIYRINDKLVHIDEQFDNVRASIGQNTKVIEEHTTQINELFKKLQEKVNCDLFDSEIKYLKAMLQHLRK